MERLADCSRRGLGAETEADEGSQRVECVDKITIEPDDRGARAADVDRSADRNIREEHHPAKKIAGERGN